MKNKEIVIFYLKLDEKVRIERMKARGDDIEKIKSRIENDRDAFTLNDAISKIIDVEIDTEKMNIQEVSDFVYNKYIEILKKRKVNIKK